MLTTTLAVVHDRDVLLRVATDCRRFVRLLERVYGDRVRTAAPEESEAPEVRVLRHRATPKEPWAAGERGPTTSVVVNPETAVERFCVEGRALALDERRHVVVLRSESLGRCDDDGARRLVTVYSRCRGPTGVIDAYTSDDAFRVVRSAVYLLEHGSHSGQGRVAGGEAVRRSCRSRQTFRRAVQKCFLDAFLRA
jgi:hypothetical protein